MNLKYIKKDYLLLLFLMVTTAVSAQQNEEYSQNLYNLTSINPAYAGSRGRTDIFSLYRMQWTGLEGAPKTMIAAINGPLKNPNLGLGLTFLNDKIGPSDVSSVSADFSYGIKVSANYKLAFGLKASASLLNVDFSELYLADPNDPAFESNIDNKFSPNIGVGFYLHSDKTFVGISAPNLLKTTFYDRYKTSAANTRVAREDIRYFLTVAHEFDLSWYLKFKPMLLVNAQPGELTKINLSTNFLLYDKLTLGMSYKFGGTITNLVGFQISDSMFLGYGYDLETTKLANYNSGSHDFFLRYSLPVRTNSK
jgi:type IX secretion system PorP/SprF family membrane protein